MVYAVKYETTADTNTKYCTLYTVKGGTFQQFSQLYKYMETADCSPESTILNGVIDIFVSSWNFVNVPVQRIDKRILLPL